MNAAVIILGLVLVALWVAYRRRGAELELLRVQLRDARTRILRRPDESGPMDSGPLESSIRTLTDSSAGLVLVFMLASSGCASWPANARACAPGSVLAVIDLIASRGQVDPDRVLDAGACWLDRFETRPQLEAAPAAVPELRAAIEAKDPGAAADALVRCDSAAPEVVR